MIASKRVYGILLLLIAAVLLFAACSSEQPNASEPGDAAGDGTGGEAILDDDHPAVAIYEVSCIVCHGTDLEGRVGEKSNLKQVGARLSRDDIEATIRQGKGLMPSFEGKLSDEEISQLSDWLAQRQ